MMKLMDFIRGKASGAVDTTQPTGLAESAQGAVDQYDVSADAPVLGGPAPSDQMDMIAGITGLLDNASAARVRGRRYDPTFAAEHKDQLRQTLEAPRAMMDYTPPAVPRFQEFVQLDLDSFRDPDVHVRRTTIESIEYHYMAVRDDIYAQIDDAKQRALSPNINEAKMYMKIGALLKEQLFTLERELDQLHQYREHSL